MAAKKKKVKAVKKTTEDKDTEAGPKPQRPRGPQPSGDPLYDNNIHMFMTDFNEESCGMAIRFILEKNVLPSKSQQ